MRTSQRSSSQLFKVICTAVFLAFVCIGCSSDDLIPEVPADQVVEAGLNDAMQTTVVPLVTFFGAMSNFLAAPLAAPHGFSCPDTTGWCSTGSVACTPTGTGLAFNWDVCLVVTGDAPITLDGDITVVPGSPTVGLTLTNLFINDSPAISGTGTINTSSCDYVVNVATPDATVSGNVTKCASDPYPTGDSLLIGFSDFLVTITFDGSNTAAANGTKGGVPVAVCTIDLNLLTSSCDPV